MRKRSPSKSTRHAGRLRDPLRIQVTQEEILADLLYPASLRRVRRVGR